CSRPAATYHNPLSLHDALPISIFERVLGERTWIMRPPGGARSARIDGLLAERGYTQMLWNLGTGDFQVRSADDVMRIWLRVLERDRKSTRLNSSHVKISYAVFC